MYLFYSYEEMFPFQTSITPTPPPPLPPPPADPPQPTESTHHSASFTCYICHGAARSKRRHSILEIGPCGIRNQPLQDNSPLVLALPSPLLRPLPPSPPPALKVLVRWADLLTARPDTRKLVDNGSQTRRASVSISPAENASPPGPSRRQH